MGGVVKRGCPPDSEAWAPGKQGTVMGIISWIVIGLVAGAIAKLIMPGRDPGGIIVTILIGMVGAVVGGFIAKAVGFGGVDGIDIRSILVATVGAVILLIAYRLVKSKA